VAEERALARSDEAAYSPRDTFNFAAWALIKFLKRGKRDDAHAREEIASRYLACVLTETGD